MTRRLSFAEFLQLSKTSPRVALFQDIDLTDVSIIDFVAQLDVATNDIAIIESGMDDSNQPHRTTISFGAIAQFQVENHLISERIGRETTTYNDEPLGRLRQFMQKFHCAEIEPELGAIGFISYDAIRLFETIPDRHRQQANLADIFLTIYQTTLCLDHLKQTLRIIIHTDVGDQPEQSYEQGMQQIDTLAARISQASRIEPIQVDTHDVVVKQVSIDRSDAEYIAAVERAKTHIIAGDAFQIVLSRCFRKPFTTPPLEIYRALRELSPAPYLFYLATPFAVFLGSSPETLIRVNQGHITINPIAGTRPRRNAADELRNKAELLNDPKDQAEHLMLVDLARNDLGSVCKPGTVTVHELLQTKHFSHVTHLTSTVIGELRDDCDAIAALAAVFPAGTLSGAPKIRAMQIIDDLETSKRGLYGGAICRLDFQGNLESCIAIRMAMLHQGLATVRSGAGIVYDSNPQAEADETRHKACGVLNAIQLAEDRHELRGI